MAEAQAVSNFLLSSPRKKELSTLLSRSAFFLVNAFSWTNIAFHVLRRKVMGEGGGEIDLSLQLVT